MQLLFVKQHWINYHQFCTSPFFLTLNWLLSAACLFAYDVVYVRYQFSVCLLLHDFINKKLPNSFSNYFTTCKDLYTINTRSASKGHIFVPDVDTVTYGRKSIKHQAILSWNYLIDLYPMENFISMSRFKFKQFIRQHFTNSYLSIPVWSYVTFLVIYICNSFLLSNIELTFTNFVHHLSP